MRVIFMGTPALAVPSLDALVAAGHTVSLVVAQPDRPAGRGGKLRAPPVAVRAGELGIPLYQPEKVRTRAFMERMAAENPDVIAVVAYGRILGPRVLALAPHGCVNVHASLLPRHRGAGPIQWSIIDGDAVTGVCTQRMVAELDAGDVLLSAETPIAEDDTTSTLGARLSKMGAELLVETLARLEAGSVEPTPQDHAQATFARPLTVADGELDFSQPARALHCRVRGVTPWPGARVRLKGEVLKLKTVELVPAAEAAPGAPGTVVRADDSGLDIAAGDGGALRILRAQRAGKRSMDVGPLLRGWPVAVGTRVDEVPAEG